MDEGRPTRADPTKAEAAQPFSHKRSRGLALDEEGLKWPVSEQLSERRQSHPTHTVGRCAWTSGVSNEGA